MTEARITADIADEMTRTLHLDIDESLETIEVVYRYGSLVIVSPPAVKRILSKAEEPLKEKEERTKKDHVLLDAPLNA